MAQPNVLILRAPGTNCDQETAFAFERAGATAELVHVNRMLEMPDLIDRFQILCIPGGFSYGDDVSAGRILACQIQHHLVDRLSQFQADGKLLLGICNGFQVLLKSGILLESDTESGPPATLTWNDSGTFEDRWVRLRVEGNRSVFLDGIESLYLPIAHAEGKFVARDSTVLVRLDQSGQAALRYETSDNPNGSERDIAGVCDPTGHVLGLMPHPERHLERTHHPRWTRGEGDAIGHGLAIFENAVRYFAS